MSSSFLASLVSLEQTLKVDIVAAVGKPVIASIESIETNPTVPNVIAQKVVVAGAVIGALPQLESEGISAVATWLLGEVQPLLASPTPAAPPTAGA